MIQVALLDIYIWQTIRCRCQFFRRIDIHSFLFVWQFWRQIAPRSIRYVFEFVISNSKSPRDDEINKMADCTRLGGNSTRHLDRDSISSVPMPMCKIKVDRCLRQRASCGHRRPKKEGRKICARAVLGSGGFPARHRIVPGLCSPRSGCSPGRAAGWAACGRGRACERIRNFHFMTLNLYHDGLGVAVRTYLGLVGRLSCSVSFVTYWE